MLALYIVYAPKNKKNYKKSLAEIYIIYFANISKKSLAYRPTAVYQKRRRSFIPP